jgi:ribosomal protein S18 acetylase RimI-like enzyme
MAVVYTCHIGVTPLLVDVLADLYAVVYAEPPYCEGPEQVAGFRDRLPGEAERQGFTMVTAHEGGALVGAVYGWTMPAGRWWSRAHQPPPADLLDIDKAAIMEWVVHPHHRRQGVGGQLMRRLLADRTEPVATLASDPRSEARRIYEQAGWMQVGESATPWGAHMHLLVLPLGR